MKFLDEEILVIYQALKNERDDLIEFIENIEEENEKAILHAHVAPYELPSLEDEKVFLQEIEDVMCRIKENYFDILNDFNLAFEDE